MSHNNTSECDKQGVKDDSEEGGEGAKYHFQSHVYGDFDS
jgi:hypothetical protein